MSTWYIPSLVHAMGVARAYAEMPVLRLLEVMEVQW